jgi:hypothetical protein
VGKQIPSSIEGLVLSEPAVNPVWSGKLARVFYGRPHLHEQARNLLHSLVD